jgi:hypothetical protein
MTAGPPWDFVAFQCAQIDSVELYGLVAVVFAEKLIIDIEKI